ncbi:MAG: tetratricopeptide repeat protein [Methanomassiliicoccales archaeon]|jgi:tetratricopeptide (TPR) repeat protein
MTDFSRLLDERLDERIISAINDLDFQQFQELITNLLKSIGVIVTSKEELGDAVMFRGEGEGGAYLIMASRLFDHSSIMSTRRVRALATSEGRSAVIMLTNDMDPDAKDFADKEGVSYADKKRLLLLLRKYQLADALMQEIDRRVLEADGERVLPSAWKFDQHMLAAIEHMGKGRFKDAIYCLDRALELKPSNDQVWQSRANALFNLGRLEEALEACRKATELRPGEHASWYLMGLILGQMGDFEEEVKAYDVVLKIQPGNRSAILNKGTALYRMGKLEKSIKVFDLMLKDYPSDVMAYNNRGIVLKALGRTKDALESFQRASVLDRNYINPLINMGVIHTECGQNELAIEDWKGALQLERRRPDILISLASSFMAVGDTESALHAARSALEIDPDMQEAKALRDELEALLAPPPSVEAPACEEAPKEVVPEAETVGPEPIEGPQDKGEQHPAVIEGERLPMEVERPGAVVRVEEPSVPVKIDEPTAIVGVEEGPSALAKMDGPGAVVTVERPSVPAMIEGPSVPAVVRNAGAIVDPGNEAKDIVPAGDDGVPAGTVEVARALKGVELPSRTEGPEAQGTIEPIDPLRRHELTIKFMMLVGDQQQAMVEVDRALEVHLEEPSLLRLKASVLAASGRHDAALMMMSRLYSKVNDERILYDIEAISYLFGQKKEGAQILRRMRPSKESVARELSFLLDTEQFDDIMVKASKTGVNTSDLSMTAQALALMRKGRYRDAAKVWKDIISKFPANAECLNNLGVCMRFMGEYGYEEPIKFMLLATVLDPMYADGYSNAASAYFAAGAYDQALEFYEKAISIDRKPEYYLNMSSVQLAIGDVEAAKGSLTSALKLEESPEVLYMLAIIAEREGDLKWAARLYEDALTIRPDFKDAVYNLQRIKLQLKFRS